MFTLKKKKHTQVFCQIYKNFLEVKLSDRRKTILIRYAYLYTIA